MIRAKPLLMLLLGVALGGCAAGSGRLDEATLQDTVAQMKLSDVTTGDLRVPEARQIAARPGESFGDELRKAVLRNERVQASARQLRASEAGIRVAESVLRPQLTGTVSAGGIAERDADNRLGGALDFSLSQLVFDGGAAAAQIDASTARAFAARAEVLVAGNTAGEAAARAWIDVWDYSARLSLLRARVAEVEGIKETLERMITNGFIDRASLAAAERQVLDIRLEEERLSASLRDAQARFERLLGYRPGSVPAPPSLLSRGEPNALRGVWRDAPEMTSAAAQLIALERDLQSARAQMRPVVAVRAGVMSPVSSNDSPNVTLGLTLRHSFGDGGRRVAEIEALEERVSAGRLRLEDLKKEAETELESSLALYSSLLEGRATLIRQIEVIEHENSTLRSQLSSGQATLSQVVEGEVRYFRARSRQIELTAEIARLEIGMIAGTGVLTQRLGIDLDSLL